MDGSADGHGAPVGRPALDDLGTLLLADEDVHSVLQRVADLAKGIMQAGTEASITLVRDSRPTTAAVTGALASELDQVQYRQGHGPCLEAALGGSLIEITDGRTEDRWPEYMATFRRRGMLSSLAVPVPAAQFTAGLNLYAPVAHAFSPDRQQALTELAAYAAVALANMDTLQGARDQAVHLQAAMASRAAIEQAKGILIERYKVTPEQAFRLLSEASMATNRKLRELAEELVLTGELAPRRPARVPPQPGAGPATAGRAPTRPPRSQRHGGEPDRTREHP